MSFEQMLTVQTPSDAHIAVVNAHNETTIRVICHILETTTASFSLYNTQDVSELIRSFDLTANMFARISMQTFESEEDALTQCMKDLDDGRANILMKGHIPTSHLLSAVLKHNSKQGQHFLNHVALFDIPDYHKPLMISDVALNIQPTVSDIKAMIDNISIFAKQLDYKTLKIALLSSTETIQSKLPSSIQAQEIKDMFMKQDISSLMVDGPFALDNIIDKKSALQKGIQSDVAGDADVIIVPHLDVGNALYKSLTYFGHAKVASVVIGARFPIVLTSRADSMSNKINAIQLAMKILVK